MIKVHIIKTPEYAEEECLDIIEFLTSFQGPLKFVFQQIDFRIGDFPFLMKFRPDFKFRYDSDIKKMEYNTELGYPLSWRELFSLCDHYRVAYDITSDDFVILLTTRRNALNWFSHEQNRNVFVHTGDWDYYTDAHPKYPIVYQIIENVMQSLMKLDTISIPNDYIHHDARGCMNDFCQHKEQVLLKLRTADICGSCMHKIMEENIDHDIVVQVNKIFEGIRQELLFKQKAKVVANPSPILITARKQILLTALNNLEIHLNPLFKTLYIFLLQHPAGVKLKELSGHQKELTNIYSTLSVNDNRNMVNEKIADLINPLSNSFSQKKSKINKIITELLGDSLSRYYLIEGKRGEAFKINIPKSMVKIE